MKRIQPRYFVKSLYLITVVGVFLLMGCATTSPTATPATECDPVCPVDIQPETPAISSARPSLSEMVPRITIDELKQKMESGEDIVVVDSRHKEEYDVDHIKGAVSAPLSVVVAGEWTAPLDKELIFYCS